MGIMLLCYAALMVGVSMMWPSVGNMYVMSVLHLMFMKHGMMQVV